MNAPMLCIPLLGISVQVGCLLASFKLAVPCKSKVPTAAYAELSIEVHVSLADAAPHAAVTGLR